MKNINIQEYEDLRLKYKPENVKVLLVATSIPPNGTFFYKMDSPLYKYTKQAFEEIFPDEEFSLELFAKKGFFLVDMSDEPVNNIHFIKKHEAMGTGIVSLSEKIKTYTPEYLISLIDDDVKAIYMANILAENVVKEENIFDMIQPFLGNHEGYKNLMVEKLKIIFSIK